MFLLTTCAVEVFGTSTTMAAPHAAGAPYRAAPVHRAAPVAPARATLRAPSAPRPPRADPRNGCGPGRDHHVGLQCVTAVPPTFTDPSCAGGSSTGARYTIPSANGVVYSVGFHLVRAGTVPASAGATITVAAWPTFGHVITGQRTFTHTFSRTPACSTPVRVPAVSFRDAGCTTPSSFTVPAVSGVHWTVGGSAVEPGRHRAADRTTVTVHASGNRGYVVHGATSFTHTFAAAPRCPTTPGAGAGSARGNASGNRSGSTAGDRSGSSTSGAGAVAADTSRVSRQVGHVVTGSRGLAQLALRSGSVVPEPAAFTDDTCGPSGPTGASYRIPVTTGVEYLVNGISLGAGTFPATDGSTVTVVAAALPGYTVTGISQWTHTFGAAPSTCTYGTAGESTSAPSPSASSPSPNRSGRSTSVGSTPNTNNPVSTNPPAYTGVPVSAILLTGIAIVLMGIAAHVAAGFRRERIRP